MACEIRVTDNARDDLSALDARWRSAVKAAKDEALITRHGKPAAILIGFADEDDWFDYRLEHDERFLKRIAKSREQAQRGALTRLEDLPGK